MDEDEEEERVEWVERVLLVLKVSLNSGSENVGESCSEEVVEDWVDGVNEGAYVVVVAILCDEVVECCDCPS